jgi:hypothetical protein
MKARVILSAAKDLQFRSGEIMQILRFAQNDRLFRMTGFHSLFILVPFRRTSRAYTKPG